MTAKGRLGTIRSVLSLSPCGTLINILRGSD